MNRPQKAIINALEKHKTLTPLELQLLTDQVYSSLTSRLSELRRLVFGIQLEKVATSKYKLVVKPDPIDKKILDWVEKNDTYNKELDYDLLTKQLNLSTSDIVDGMVDIFKSGRLIQRKNNCAIIKKVNR